MDTEFFNRALAQYREETGDTTELMDMSVAVFSRIIQAAQRLKRTAQLDEANALTIGG